MTLREAEMPRTITAGLDGSPESLAAAVAADFFSFGTNDLTQTTWGLSRDDAEASFFSVLSTIL
ncbi:putative PEP-binding protein [Streptomyces sp. NPDC002144]